MGGTQDSNPNFPVLTSQAFPFSCLSLLLFLALNCLILPKLPIFVPILPSILYLRRHIYKSLTSPRRLRLRFEWRPPGPTSCFGRTLLGFRPQHRSHQIFTKTRTHNYCQGLISCPLFFSKISRYSFSWYNL